MGYRSLSVESIITRGIFPNRKFTNYLRIFFCNNNINLRYIDMKVATTSTGEQTFKVVPREYVTSATLDIRDESTNTSTSYSITATTDGDFLNVPATLSLIEGRYYQMTLKKTDGTIIYKDKMFCTDQSTDQTQNESYSVNNNVYTSDTSYDNEFVIL